MRVLFLDDNEHRHKALKRAIIGTGVTHLDWAINAEEAISYLKNSPKYDIVCFDHDLSDKHYIAGMNDGENADYGSEMTGYEVALFLVSELEAEKQPDYAIVHTFNSHGANRIANALSEAGLQKYIYVFPFNANRFEQTLEHIAQAHGN